MPKQTPLFRKLLGSPQQQAKYREEAAWVLLGVMLGFMLLLFFRRQTKRMQRAKETKSMRKSMRYSRGEP